jgi:hypothetical protein
LLALPALGLILPLYPLPVNYVFPFTNVNISLSSFLQVHILVDNLDIGDVNSVNLRAAVSAALLLLPSKFTEVCSFTGEPL